MGEPARMPKKLRVGYRFHPTEEELVAHFLRHKLKDDDPLIDDTIAEIDVCEHDPQDLPAYSAIESDDSVWFFFSARDKGTRFKRRTPSGYWKITGKGKVITDKDNRPIGTKKILVFYKGHVPNGVKTDWVIHEYHHDDTHDLTFPAHQRTYVLCKLIDKQKIPESKTYEIVHDEREPSGHTISEDENPEGHCMDSLNQMPLDEFVNSMEIDEFINSMIQPPLNSGTQTSHESDIFMDSSIQTSHESDYFLDSSIQTPHESNEFSYSSVQTLHEAEEFVDHGDSLIQTLYESDKYMNSSIQIPHEPNKLVNLWNQTAHEVDEVMDLLIQTSPQSYKETAHESYVFLDSSMEELVKSFEYEVNPFLQLSPTMHEQELLGN